MDSHTDRAVLCAGNWIQNRLLTHIRYVWRYKYEIQVVSLLPYCTVELFRQFRVVDECQSVRICTLLDRFSVTLRCGVSPQRVMWLLKSPITMWSLILCPSGGSRNGGLYRKCTTTPVSFTVMNSTFSSSHTEMLFTFRPSLTKPELPCLLCGRSATSVIPGIFGLAWSLPRCVYWRHKQWQCYILLNSDSMDALLADRPSTFADITVIAPEGLWLCTANMVWGIIHKFDVLEESVNKLTRWIGLVVLQGSRRARFFHSLAYESAPSYTPAMWHP